MTERKEGLYEMRDDLCKALEEQNNYQAGGIYRDTLLKSYLRNNFQRQRCCTCLSCSRNSNNAYKSYQSFQRFRNLSMAGCD